MPAPRRADALRPGRDAELDHRVRPDDGPDHRRGCAPRIRALVRADLRAEDPRHRCRVVDRRGRPFGYTRDGMALEPTDAADTIRDAVHRVLAGESVHSITTSWQLSVPPVRGGKWHAQNVSRILTRPRNAKLAAHHEEVVGQGAWPTIITEDEHHAVCAILCDPARTTYCGVRSLKWVGSGLYRCGRCGADMRSASNMTRDGATRVPPNVVTFPGSADTRSALNGDHPDGHHHHG